MSKFFRITKGPIRQKWKMGSMRLCVQVSQESLERLGAGCIVVEALGPKVSVHLLVSLLC